MCLTRSKVPPNSRQNISGPARSVLRKATASACCNGLRTDKV